MIIEDPIHKDLFDDGQDSFGQNPLSFSGNEVNQKTQTIYEAGVPSNFVQTGDIIQRLNLIDGWLQSDNFVAGISGWRIDSDGNVEFQSGNFRGNITGASGIFGGLTINVVPDTIMVNDGVNDRVLIGKLEGKF